MTNQDLASYARQRATEGMPPEEIRSLLAKQGWGQADIDQALALSAPAAATAPVANAHETLVPQAGHHPKHLGLIIGIVAAALLAGGATFAYFAYFRETPMQALEKAVAKMQTVKAVDLRSTLDFAYDPADMALLPIPTLADPEAADEKEAPFDKIFVAFDGRFDWMDENKKKSAVELRLASKKDEAETELFSLETRSLTDMLYVKLRIPKRPEASFLDLSPIQDRWISVNIPQIKEQLKAMFPSAKVTTAENKLENLTDAQKDELIKAFREANVITGLSAHPDESIDGTPSRHFTLQLDEVALRSFLDKAAEIVGQETEVGKELESASEKTDDVLHISTADVWISKKDGMFKRVRMPMEDAKERKNPDGTPDEKKVKVIADVVFNSFNQPVNVEAPADAKDIVELFQEFMSSLGGDASMFGAMPKPDPVDGGGVGARTLSEVRQIQTGLELAYSETNEYPVSEAATVVSWSNSILCKDGLKSVWTLYRSACTGTVYVDFDDDGSAVPINYAYTAPKGGQSYELRFELPEAAGAFKAGPHCANPYGISAGACDTDEDIDGLMSREEVRYGTDPAKYDTDGDGFSDGHEVENGFNPLGDGSL